MGLDVGLKLVPFASSDRRAKEEGKVTRCAAQRRFDDGARRVRANRHTTLTPAPPALALQRRYGQSQDRSRLPSATAAVGRRARDMMLVGADSVRGAATPAP